jgi:hypothetical protein
LLADHRDQPLGVVEQEDVAAGGVGAHDPFPGAVEIDVLAQGLGVERQQGQLILREVLHLGRAREDGEGGLARAVRRGGVAGRAADRDLGERVDDADQTGRYLM